MTKTENATSFISFSREMFLRIVDSTTKYCDQDRKSGVLQGVEIKLDKDSLSFRSTDRFRFSILNFHRANNSKNNDINWDNLKSEKTFKVVISRWCLWDVKDHLIDWDNSTRNFAEDPNEPGIVKLVLKKNGELSCLVDDLSIPLLPFSDPENFPDLESCLPLKYANDVSFNKFELYKKLSRLRINHGDNLVRIILRNCSCFAEVFINENDKYSGSKCKLKQKPDLLNKYYKITLDIDYALEGLEIFSGNYISLKFNSPSELVSFKSSDENIEFLHAIQPCV